jgi:branched-chain amino acid transport system permease protein
MHDFAQQLVNGLSIGAVYALIALGYTMVYGVLRLINFAHGEVYMTGAVVGFYVAGKTVQHLPGQPAHPMSPWISLPLVFGAAMLACAVLGFLIEFLAYRPLRNSPRLVALITAIGVSLLLQNSWQLIFGPTPRTLRPPLIEPRVVISIPLGDPSNPVTISNMDLLSLGLAVAVMLLLSWIVLKTRTGLALRAVSYRFDTASLMGINTNRIISFTFVLGSVLAAVAGVVDAMRYDVRPLMGLMPGLKAFIAAVLGGIGSIPGALLGGILIGLLETMAKGYVSSAYGDAASFVVLILILLVKPSGLLGQTAPEKV